MKIELSKGEEVVRVWDDCTLTNFRIWRSLEKDGGAEYRGVPLRHFSGAIIGKRSSPGLLYAALVFGFLGLLNLVSDSSSAPVFVGTLILAGFFLGAWHLSKRAYLKISSDSVKIEKFIHANRKDYEDALQFVADVEQQAIISIKYDNRAA